MKTKQFEPDDFQVNPDSREVVAVISTDTVDRDGEVMLPSGLVKKQYAGNPVVLYGHDKTLPPIGMARWIKSSGNKLIAKYYISDKTELARDVFGLMQDGVLRAHSIGFLDTEATAPTREELAERPDWKDCRRVVRQWELLEFSVVPIPCNPDCLALAVAKCAAETRKILGAAWEPEPDCIEWETKAFSHNSEVADKEPDWGSVDKTHLPRLAFARKEGSKSDWGYPHHWVKDGGKPDDDGCYTTGTMYLHAGGLNAAWAAAQGAHTGKPADAEVIKHLQAHRKALGLEKEIPQPIFCRSWKSIEQRINSIMQDRLSATEILARLTGKA
jgi:phage head maturation protease